MLVMKNGEGRGGFLSVVGKVGEWRVLGFIGRPRDRESGVGCNREGGEAVQRCGLDIRVVFGVGPLTT